MQQFLPWGAWQSWRECTETCGSSGVRERVRYRINPVPTNGGRECRGSSSETEPCNRKLCPSNCFCSNITLNSKEKLKTSCRESEFNEDIVSIL